MLSPSTRGLDGLGFGVGPHHAGHTTPVHFVLEVPPPTAVFIARPFLDSMVDRRMSRDEDEDEVCGSLGLGGHHHRPMMSASPTRRE